MLFASLVHPIRFPLGPVRLLSLLLPIIVVAALPAQAAENALDTPAAARKHYDIPAGPLGRALSHFATVAGIALSFDPVLTEGLTSPALTGNFSVGKGFNRLLADSGLELMRNADSSYTLRQAPIKATQAGVTALPVVTVSTSTENADDTGYVAQRSSSSTKTDTPLIEVPQSISVITRRELDARLVQNISQAVSYTPGVLTEMYGPVMRDDYFNIRGFDAPQFLDGLGLWGVNYANLRIEPYGMESIEVLKGPSSTLYGQSSPGGLVAMMSKRPTAVPIREAFITGGSFGRIQGGLDLGGPIDSNGQFLYRLTGLVRNSDTQINHAHEDRYFIAPSISWRPTGDTTFTLLSHFQKDNAGNTLQFLPPEGSLLENPNGQIPTSRFIGEPGFDKYNREQYTIGYAFDHRFNESWGVQQNLRYANVSSNYPTTFYLDFLRDDDGVPLDFRTIDRLAALYQDKAGTFTMDTRVQGVFDTTMLRHNLLLGIDYRYLSGNNRRGFSEDMLLLDIYDPVYGQPFGLPVIDLISKQQRDQIGLYAQDQIKYDRWILTLGVRYDFSSAHTRNHDLFFDERSSTRQNDRAFTYRTGINYLFDNGIAPYASYAESFQPIAGTDFFGSPFKPTTGRQYEAGIKYQPVNHNALLTVAAYHLTQKNVVTPDLMPGHFGYNVQTGEARVRGVEVEGKANLMNNLNLIVAYSFADSKVTESNNPDELGNRLSLTPRHQTSAWLDYTFRGNLLAGLGVAGGVRHIGSNFGDLVNNLKAPSYTLFDTAVRYDMKHLHSMLRGASLSVNVNNLFDNKYIATCADMACFYGNRRTVYATLRYKW